MRQFVEGQNPGEWLTLLHAGSASGAAYHGQTLILMDDGVQSSYGRLDCFTPTTTDIYKQLLSPSHNFVRQLHLPSAQFHLPPICCTYIIFDGIFSGSLSHTFFHTQSPTPPPSIWTTLSVALTPSSSLMGTRSTSESTTKPPTPRSVRLVMNPRLGGLFAHTTSSPPTQGPTARSLSLAGSQTTLCM
jgi:hypothetical protein